MMMEVENLLFVFIMMNILVANLIKKQITPLMLADQFCVVLRYVTHEIFTIAKHL